MVLNTDDWKVERMADSFSMMDEEERSGWSLESAADWIHDEYLYATQHGFLPLLYDTQDVYDTIRAMIETERGEVV